MRYAVLLSGGVDSSTALRELVRDGTNEVTAYYLKVWLEDELDDLGECPWEEDLRYAREVCGAADVRLEVVPLQLEYYERVVSYALAELRAGRTPSPDIFCNERIKFGAFLEYLGDRPGAADWPGAAGWAGTARGVRVATGHYARLADAGDHVELLRSPDPVKDQTYFLAHLRQEQLQRLAFPIGSMTKDEVRARAREYRLPNRDRPDSQGICFLGKVRYPEFIRHYLGERPGSIVEHETGRELGRHRGYWFYTIGQRQGLGLAGGPWYVVRKDVGQNVIYVAHALAAQDRARRSFRVTELSWTWRSPLAGPDDSAEVTLRLRHGPTMIPASIRMTGHGTLVVEMQTADRGVAPGQFAVFYDGEICLGGGRIGEE